MRSAESALAILVAEVGADSSHEAWVDDGVAFLRVGSPTHPGRFAIVSTPGDVWFAVTIDDGFKLPQFVDVESDVELVEVLRQLLGVARAYVERGGALIKPGTFSPSVGVEFEGRQYVFRRSIDDSLRRFLFRRARARNQP